MFASCTPYSTPGFGVLLFQTSSPIRLCACVASPPLAFLIIVFINQHHCIRDFVSHSLYSTMCNSVLLQSLRYGCVPLLYPFCYFIPAVDNFNDDIGAPRRMTTVPKLIYMINEFSMNRSALEQTADLVQSFCLEDNATRSSAHPTIDMASLSACINTDCSRNLEEQTSTRTEP
ncbi:hypothetical protein L218DRAFT_372992 [Marasmius fiardii PR-910]|nr:hypothetical protein L218DRAFT_372992 [Marasmius fiardii PR-910]